MQYRLLEHTTRKFSKQFLKNIYVLSNSGHEHCYGCVPNGEIGISIVVTGQSYVNLGGEWIPQSKANVYGLIDKIQFHKMSAGYREINIGFDPQYLQLFLRDSMSSLLKRQATELSDLFGEPSVDQLYKGLSFAECDDEILDIVELFLEQHLIEESVDPRILRAYDLICHEGVWNIEQVSQMVNVSSATLRNLFRDKVGITPKDLVKITRLKYALHTREHTDESLTSLAYKLNYYDQSHFIHEFKQAIGLTPKQYFENERLTFDFYNFQRWSLDSFTGLTHSLQ